jgi:2-polyprenyl-3-methyl-5-hydroxy-6-metoxy-1,4-benzoquinol methylase
MIGRSSKLKNKIIRQWDKLAPWWSQFIGKNGDVARKGIILPALLNLLENFDRPRRILDAGCGEGYFCRMLCNGDTEVVGVDISTQQLIYAAKKTPRSLKKQITFVQDDLESLKLIENSRFTLSLCVNALMDTPHVRHVFERLADKLCQQGILIVVILHPATFGPSGAGLRFLNARILKRHNSEVCYSVRLDPAAPVRTIYFNRPTTHYINAAPSSLRMISSLDLSADFKSSRSLFKLFGSAPIFKLLAWTKG